MSIEIRVFREQHPLDYTRYCRLYCTRCHTTTIHRKVSRVRGYRGIVRTCIHCGREVRFSERVRSFP